MSSLRRHPPELVDEDDDVNVDNIDAYLRLEDEDHDLYASIELDNHPWRLYTNLQIVK